MALTADFDSDVPAAPPDLGEVNALAQIAAPAVQTGSGEGGDEESVNDKLLRWSDPRKTLNIADELDEELLTKIGQRCEREYKIDDQSRSGWMAQSEDAMRLAMQVAEKKSYPWDNASNIVYPLMTVSAIQFAARAYPAIIAGRNVVKGCVYGDDKGRPVIDPQTGQPAMQQGPDGQPQPVWQVPPGAKRARADRIGEHMSWQLLNEMKEWEDDTDKLLHILPIVGCAFRKSYFDPTWARNMSLLVRAENIVVNYWATSLDLAPRITEYLSLYPVQIEERIRAGTFLDEEALRQESATASSGDDEDAPREFLEQHRLLDLDEDGYPEPYIVTLRKDNNKVARIVARFDPDGVHFSKRNDSIIKIDPVQYYTKYDFLPNIENGIYGMGFGQLLKPINEGVNTTLNMMIDAGHKQVVGGGFIGRGGLNLHAGPVKFKMGQYVPVNALGSAIRDSIVHLESPGPNAVLFQLLGMLVEAGRDIASVKDVLSGENMSANMPATTVLAMIEQGLKVFTGIYKRVYRAEKSEFDKLYRLNRVYLDEQAGYSVGEEWKTIRREDYARGDGVEPISDPRMVSDMQKLGRAAVLEKYQADPLVNPIEVRRRIFEAAEIDGIDDLLADEVPQTPPDPAIELARMQVANEGLKNASRARLDRVDEILKKAQAINQLAQADKATSGTLTEWINTQLAVAKHEMELLNAGTEPEAAGGPGPDGSGLPALASPPGDPLVPAVPA